MSTFAKWWKAAKHPYWSSLEGWQNAEIKRCAKRAFEAGRKSVKKP